MATSVDDLLTVLDHETARQDWLDPRDAARALDWTARLLTYLRTSGIGADFAPARDDVVRRFADACSVASITFESDRGRASDLIAVTTDAVRCLRQNLTSADAWTVAIRLGAPACKLASVIANSGPYTEVPQLLSVADRASELLHVAAVSPPNLANLHGHDLPIPATLSRRHRSSIQAIVDSAANLAAEFRRRGRDPMTVRELLAVSQVATRVAAYVEAGSGSATSSGRRQEGALSRAWQDVRDVLALYTDGTRVAQIRGNQSSVLTLALHVEAAVRHASDFGPDVVPAAGVDAVKRDVERAGPARLIRHLQQLATASELELARIRPMLFVEHGPSPLHEDRVGEWLRNQPFAAEPPDLVPARDALQHAAVAAAGFVNHARIAATFRSCAGRQIPGAELRASGVGL